MYGELCAVVLLRSLVLLKSELDALRYADSLPVRGSAAVVYSTCVALNTRLCFQTDVGINFKRDNTIPCSHCN
jgi:hypothetical protein